MLQLLLRLRSPLQSLHRQLRWQRLAMKLMFPPARQQKTAKQAMSSLAAAAVVAAAIATAAIAKMERQSTRRTETKRLLPTANCSPGGKAWLNNRPAYPPLRRLRNPLNNPKSKPGIKPTNSNLL